MLCQAHQVLQDQLAPLDPLEFQVLLGQLVSLDNKVHGVRRDLQVKL